MSGSKLGVVEEKFKHSKIDQETISRMQHRELKKDEKGLKNKGLRKKKKRLSDRVDILGQSDCMCSEVLTEKGK